MNNTTKQEIEDKLIVGAKIKIGKQSSNHCGFSEGEIIELIQGEFEHDNGLYVEMQDCPAVWDEKMGDFASIYHLFGNQMEDFLDCEIL